MTFNDYLQCMISRPASPSQSSQRLCKSLRVQQICMYVYASINEPTHQTQHKLRPVSMLTLWISEGLTQAKCYSAVFREDLSEAILVGIMLVGRLGVFGYGV